MNWFARSILTRNLLGSGHLAPAASPLRAARRSLSFLNCARPRPLSGQRKAGAVSLPVGRPGASMALVVSRAVSVGAEVAFSLAHRPANGQPIRHPATSLIPSTEQLTAATVLGSKAVLRNVVARSMSNDSRGGRCGLRTQGTKTGTRDDER